jgi:hypothetical protein
MKMESAIQKLKDGMLLELTQEEKKWLIEQAEKADKLTKGIKEVRKFIDDKSGSVDNPKRLTMDDTFEVFMKLTRLL